MMRFVLAPRERVRHVANPLHASTLLAFVLALFASTTSVQAAERIVIGSKNFEESRLLAEMFARLVEEHTDLEVERRFNLAGTEICLEALRTGAIDLYPEYTGTGLVSILKLPSDTDPARVMLRVRQEFLQRWDLVWLAPLGFENAYEIAIRTELAERHGIRSISDLESYAPELRAAFGIEFLNRPDGWPGLAETYGLQFREVRSLQQHLKFEAAGSDEADVIDVYTTDGHIVKYGLTVLEDDRAFFPPYQAAPLVRKQTLEAHPSLTWVLELLSGTLDEGTVRRWNLRLQEGNVSVEEAAQDALTELGLIATSAPVPPSSALPFWQYLYAQRGYLASKAAQHIGLVAASLLLAILVAVPLGLLLERRRGAAEWVIRAVGILQTVPSIALLAFMIPLLGIGARPAIAALFLYGLFPIVRNTYSGVRDADPSAVDAAWALGMTRLQILRTIRLPLAAPFVMAGIRTAAVINVGTATLAAFIGAGGLGEPIVSGLQLADTTIILSGALPAAVLALVVDAILAGVERAVRPRGLENVG